MLAGAPSELSSAAVEQAYFGIDHHTTAGD
jgi:hypothetical protein